MSNQGVATVRKEKTQASFKTFIVLFIVHIVIYIKGMLQCDLLRLLICPEELDSIRIGYFISTYYNHCER
jgi:hypothetical protein